MKSVSVMAMVNLRDLLRPRPATPARAALVGLGAPLVATLIALPLNRTGLGSSISIYLLAVVVAATLAGLRSGLIAAVVSALAFTFFFTEPRYTLRIERGEDVVAAVVLLIVAVVAGLLLSGAVDERGRAEQREREARLLGYLATKLLSGEPLQRVLDDFAAALIRPFRLARCELAAVSDGAEISASAAAPGSSPRSPTTWARAWRS